MKRFRVTAWILTLLTLVLFVLNGCGSCKRMSEDEIFQDRIDEFFSALDDKDADKIKSLFSQAAIAGDADLDAQIQKLFSIYPNAKTEIKFDGQLGGDYENQGDKRKSTAYTTVPVISEEKYYWVYFELIYEDDFSKETIGLNRVFFYTADEYCAFFHDENAKYPDDIGLLVFSDLKLEKEIRPIEGIPYEYTPVERTITETDINVFLASNRSWGDFTEVFGAPNAQCSLRAYYEITDSDAEPQYFEIGVFEDEITYIHVVSDFEFIKCILEEEAK